MSKATKPRRQPSPPEANVEVAEVEIPPLIVSGFLADRLTIITQTSAQLVTGIGSTEAGDAVLVPCVDIQVSALSIGDEESQSVYAPTIGFENFVFVLATLAGDGARISKQLAQMSKGDLRPQDARLAQVSDLFRSAIASMQESLADIEGLRTALSEPLNVGHGAG